MQATICKVKLPGMLYAAGFQSMHAWQDVTCRLQKELSEKDMQLSSVSDSKEALEQATRDAKQEYLRLQLDKQSMQHEKQLEQVRCLT